MSCKSSTVHIMKLQPAGEGTKMSDKINPVVRTRAEDECIAEDAELSSEDTDDAEYECGSDSAPQSEVSRNLVCDLCSKQFKYEKNLQNHLIRHSRKKASQISKHLQRRNGKKYLASKTQESESAFTACGKCGVKFENENILDRHSVEEHGEDASETQTPVPTLNCNSCGRTFKSVGGRKRHRCSNLDQQQNNPKQHSVEERTVDASESRVAVPVECDSCKRTFKSKRGLQHHRCRDLDKQPFICDYCGQVFRCKQTLDLHENIHTRKKAYVCDVCNQTFAHGATLRHHRYYVHIGEKSHKCEVCGKCFIRKTALTEHVRLHTGELPYECDVCHRKFNYRANLRQHYYVHTGEYPFPCDICKKGYREKKRLLAHYVIHSDPEKEAAYMKKVSRDTETVCDVCGKEFSKPSKLKVHYRTHTGERPYRCEECGMSFIQKVALKTHSYTHTKEYPFICLVCDKGYRSCSELRKHLKKLHPKHSRP